MINNFKEVSNKGECEQIMKSEHCYAELGYDKIGKSRNKESVS